MFAPLSEPILENFKSVCACEVLTCVLTCRISTSLLKALRLFESECVPDFGLER